MDVEEFCRQSTVVVVVGKGGVGRSTTSAVLARLGARIGLDVHLVELDQARQLESLFGAQEIRDDELAVLQGSPAAMDERVPGRIRAELLTGRRALQDYLDDHGAGWATRRLVDLGMLDMVATGAPGIRAILTLSRILKLEESHQADLVVVDTPATGHALSVFSTPTGLVDATGEGPLRDQASKILEFLRDEKRCQAMVVTIPEETPVNEAVEMSYQLEDISEVTLGPIVVNAVYEQLHHLNADPYQAAREAQVDNVDPEMFASLEKAAQFRLQRQLLQKEQCERLRNELPLPQIRLPYLFTTAMGATDLDTLTDAFTLEIGRL